MSAPLDRLAAALTGRYRLERELGAGGMATVYLAEDLRHQRKVAIKVLRPELAASLGAERFLREITIAANLTHPPILPLHDSGEADGFLFYVMPYVEGQSLRDRIAREGELPVTDAARIIRDVADALAYAHSRGVVHRDIKPENVMLAGRHALVTDFGVAKAITEATGRYTLTTAGVAIGTPAYMAPEQAMADPHVDYRADFYALGVVAYELLTGRPPFAALSPQAMLAAHVTEAPEAVTKRRPAVPAPLAALVMRCLAKRAADRPQSAEELLPVLESYATPTGGITPTETAPHRAFVRPSKRLQLTAGGAALVLVVAVGAWLLLRPKPLTITFGERIPVAISSAIEKWPALSPDGRSLAYVANTDSGQMLHVRDVGSGSALALFRMNCTPSWTPDGTTIALCRWLVPRMGGPARTVRPGSIESIQGDRALYQLGDSLFVGTLDGTRESLRMVVVGRDLHSARLSLDGTRVAWVEGNSGFLISAGNVANSAVWVADVAGGRPIQVPGPKGLNLSPAWLPDGRHLLFISNCDGPRDLYMVEFDSRGRPRGDPVRKTVGLDAANVSLSADGSRAAYSHFTVNRNIYTLPIPRGGPVSVASATPLTTGTQLIEMHALSSDGRWLAFDSDRGGSQSIWLMPAGGGEPRQLTHSRGVDLSPTFSGDGREIAFYSMRHGSRDLFVVDADGTNEVRVTADSGQELMPDFSPDGRRILFDAGPSLEVQTRRVSAVARDSVGGPWGVPTAVTPVADLMGRWSPDGRRFAYWHSVPGCCYQLATRTVEGDIRFLTDTTTRIGAIRRIDWAPDGGSVYFTGGIAGMGGGVFQVPSSGGAPRLLVRDDDPAKRLYADGFTVGNGRFYLTLGETISDIYVMDVKLK
ncbi:MAG: protein kinase [Gemmatimonadota bacterium]